MDIQFRLMVLACGGSCTARGEFVVFTKDKFVADDGSRPDILDSSLLLVVLVVCHPPPTQSQFHMAKLTSGGFISRSPKKGGPVVTSLRSGGGQTLRFDRFAAQRHRAAHQPPLPGIADKLAAVRDETRAPSIEQPQPEIGTEPQQEDSADLHRFEGIAEELQTSAQSKPKVNNTVVRSCMLWMKRCLNTQSENVRTLCQLSQSRT